MASAPVMFTPQNEANVFHGGQMMPGTVVQPAGTVQYVQYAGQSVGHPINQQQQILSGTGLKEFLKVQPRTLGAIQIMIGLIHIGFGAVLASIFHYFYRSLSTIGAYPFWGGIFFIASGSVSVSAEKYPTPYMVQTSVGLNITSAVMALTGIILYCVDLSFAALTFHSYGDNTFRRNPADVGTSTILLLFSILEFSIAVTSAHFGCLAACCKNNTEMIPVSYVITGTNTAPTQGSEPPPDSYDSAIPPKME